MEWRRKLLFDEKKIDIRNAFLIFHCNLNSDVGKDTYQFLEQANINSERISKKYLLYVVFGFFVNTFVMSGFSVIICHMLIGKFDPKYVYHPFRTLWVSNFFYVWKHFIFDTKLNFRLPWNLTIQTGYYYEICYDAFMGDSYLFANGTMLLLFISICLHHNKFAKRFSYSLGKLNNANRVCNDKDVLCELIDFHTSVKE